MDFFTGVIAFLLIWWTTLFAVLPMGVKPAEHETGHMPGAPENPQLLRKVLVTTGISAIIWLIFFALVSVEIIDFRAISQAMMLEDTQ